MLVTVSRKNTKLCRWRAVADNYLTVPEPIRVFLLWRCPSCYMPAALLLCRRHISLAVWQPLHELAGCREATSPTVWVRQNTSCWRGPNLCHALRHSLRLAVKFWTVGRQPSPCSRLLADVASIVGIPHVMQDRAQLNRSMEGLHHCMPWLH